MTVENHSNPDNDVSGIFSDLVWHHYIDMMVPAFVILAPIYLAITGTDFFGLSLLNLLTWYSIALVFIIAFGIIYYVKAGIHDYNFRIYIMNALYGVGTTLPALMLPGTGILDIFADNPPIPVGQALLNVAIVLSPYTLFLFGSTFTYMSLTDPMTAEMKRVSSEVTQNDNLQARISDPKVMEDSVFGPPAVLINETIDYLEDIITKTTETSNKIAVMAEELASGSEEVNASVEEVSATSQSMSQGAATQTEYMVNIAQQTEDARDVVEKIIDQINSNVDTVSQISLQTNILALNAGIEASRAGDYGRGFAVVAENVRRLAEESKLSAEEISEVTTTVSNTLKTLFEDINQQVNEVASISEETSASAEEVSAAAEEVTASMAEISDLSGQLSNLAQEMINISREKSQ